MNFEVYDLLDKALLDSKNKTAADAVNFVTSNLDYQLDLSDTGYLYAAAEIQFQNKRTIMLFK